MSTWLITSCSGGLGKEIVLSALRQGEKVAVAARNPKKLRAFTQSYPGTALAMEMAHPLKAYNALAPRYCKESIDAQSYQPGDPTLGGKIIVNTVLNNEKSFRLLLGSAAV